MNKTLHIISQTLSILLYPLLIPTYGLILFALGEHSSSLPLPAVYWWIAIGGTLFFTLLIPLTSLFVLIKAGRVSNLYIDHAGERTTPYLYTTVSFACWTYFLYHVLHMPAFLIHVAGGATVALALVMLVNRFWKISAHLTAWGGLIGGLCSYCLYYGYQLTPMTMTLCTVVTILLMTARLYLQAHTPLQVVTGWLLGLLCTTLTTFTLYYV